MMRLLVLLFMFKFYLYFFLFSYFFLNMHLFPIAPLFHCDLTLSLSGYLVISIVIWHYRFWLFCYFHCDLTLSLLGYLVISVVIWHYRFWFRYFHCDLTLLLLVVLLFSLWFDNYLFPVIMSIWFKLNMSLLLSVIRCSLWVILLRLAYCRMYFAMVCLKHLFDDKL